MNWFLLLCRVELRLALRSFDMVIFAIIFPVGLILLLGLIGLNPSQADFAGIAAMAISATGLMGLPLTLSDYRHRKVLRSYQASPANPAALLAAQTCAQASFAVLSAILVILVSILVFGQSIRHPLLFLGAWLVLLTSTYGIGYLIAALAPNAKVAGLVCSVLYFPVLLLSGSTIPTGVFPPVVQDILGTIPFSQGILLLKQAALSALPTGHGLADSARGAIPWLYLGGLGVAGFALAVRKFRWL